MAVTSCAHENARLTDDHTCLHGLGDHYYFTHFTVATPSITRTVFSVQNHSLFTIFVFYLGVRVHLQEMEPFTILKDEFIIFVQLMLKSILASNLVTCPKGNISQLKAK